MKNTMENMPFRGTLLVCDMDKTLLNSQSKVSAKNLEALRNFTQKGGLFTIATGRMYEAVKPYITNLPINAPGILYNGAMIYDFKSNKAIWNKCLENQIYHMICDIYNRFEDVGIEVYSGDKIYIARESIDTKKHIIREVLTPAESKLEEIPFPWIKILMADEHKRLKEVEEYLKDKLNGSRTVFSEPQFLEIVEDSVSKGAALTQLKEILGYNHLRTISVGDNLNDVELIKHADIGIAVNNAHPYLKEVADMCCCHHDEDAIAQVVEWIEKNKLVEKL